MRRVAILGSTGSIGRQAVDVIAAHSGLFEVTALCAGFNLERVTEQARMLKPTFVSIAEEAKLGRLKAELGSDVRLGSGAAGLMEAVCTGEPDIVLVATDGAVAFEAAFEAVRRGIDLAVANKELIVAAGELLLPLAAKHGVRILPVDSEHSALFQCLVGEPAERIERVIITASGGPFRTWTADAMRSARPSDAMAHPTWAMGIKNTIDSATLMNKGLEVIETARLFHLPADQIDVVVHPSSFVHGFVVFTDGNIKAQMAAPDMRLPIGYALAYPDRLPAVDFPATRATALRLLGAVGAAGAEMRFEPVDRERFPALDLAYRALREGGTVPCVLSAANEIAVAAFYRERIGFTAIAEIVAAVIDAVPRRELTFETLKESDLAARETASAIIARAAGPS